MVILKVGTTYMENLMSNIIRNALRTPDGTVLQSYSGHDYKTHVDANGKTYMVDGGLEYCRRSIHEDQVNLTVTLDDDHNEVRKACSWGTRGPNGDQPLSYVQLRHMSTAHIEAVLDTQKNMYPQLRTAMENELDFRCIE